MPPAVSVATVVLSTLPSLTTVTPKMASALAHVVVHPNEGCWDWSPEAEDGAPQV